MAALIDSSVLIAAARPRERLHEQAVEVIRERESGGLAVPVTILAETMSFVGARVGLEQQRRFWDGFLDSGIDLVAVDLEMLEMARDIDRRYGDAGYGFADCTLLAATELLGIREVLSFDARLSAYRPLSGDAIRLVP